MTQEDIVRDAYIVARFKILIDNDVCPYRKSMYFKQGEPPFECSHPTNKELKEKECPANVCGEEICPLVSKEEV